MSPFIEKLMSNEVAALAIPMIIFGVVILLLVRKLISFGIMLTLLLFACGAGLLIANYDMMREKARDTAYSQQLEQVIDKLEEVKSVLLERLDDLHKEMQAQNAKYEGGESSDTPPSAIPTREVKSTQPQFPWKQQPQDKPSDDDWFPWSGENGG